MKEKKMRAHFKKQSQAEIQQFKPLKEIRLNGTSDLGLKLIKQIQSVDDGTRFVSSEDFLKHYENIIKKQT